MYKVFLSLLLPCLFAFAENEDLPYLTSECDTYALVDGVVNAYNGKLVQIDQDIQIHGVDPLELVRYYDGGHHFDSEFGYGFGCSYPALIQLDGPYLRVELRQGLEVLCILSRRKDLETKVTGEVYTGSISKFYLKESYTNCPTHLLQGEPSLLALEIYLDSHKATVSLGDGTKRHYTPFSDAFYRLEKEELPSGNLRHYFYTSHKFPFALKDICTTNKDSSLNLNWLNFKELGIVTLVTASNGQYAKYTLKTKVGKFSNGNFLRGIRGKFETDLLSQVSCDHYPPVSYQSVKNSKTFSSLFSVSEVNWANRSLEVEYDKGRVKTLRNSASRTPLYTFNYHTHHTDVVDANGAKKKYSFSDRRLISLMESHRTENFHWDENGQLTSHTIHSPEGVKHFEQTYAYDHKGNIKETNVIGNITGCGSYDCHHTEFLYDQGSNHLVSIKRNNQECIFGYVPGTNLIAYKLTLYNGHCEEREFYHYDKNGIQVLKVIDDGASADLNDFTNVTYRLLTETVPQLNPNLPGMTLAHLIKEFYVDIATRKFHPLKTTECFYAHGDLISEKRIFDAEGNHRYTLHYEYNNRRELIKETNALGESTIYAYDDAGNKIYEEKVGSGKKTHFTYDLANRLISEKDDNFTKSYSYDPMGNCIRETDIYGQATHKKYDHASREILSIDPLGYTEEKSYDLFGNITLTKDKDGHFIKTTYNIFRKPLEIVYPDGTVEWFAYDLEGRLIKEWKRDETVLSHKLDYKGRIIKTEVYSKEGSLLKTLQWIYKGPHLIAEIDALGNKTEYHLDGAGRKIKKVQGSQVTHYAYDPLGRLSKTTIEDISCTCIEYDLLDRKIEERIEDLSGKVYSKTQFEYDILGNETVCRSYSDETNYSETRTLFNSQSLPIQIIDPLGFETRFSYSQTNHLEKETIDPLGRHTFEIYNPLQRLQEKKIFSEEGVLLKHQSFIYDGCGNLVSCTDHILQDGKSIGTYEVKAAFDSVNQKILEIEQGSKITKWDYYRGKLVRLTQADGSTISYLHDPLGRITEQISSDQTIHNKFTYDLNDNILLAHHGVDDTYVERAYDSLNRMIYEKQTSGLEFFFSYDALDRIKEMHFCDGSIAYTYSPTTLISSSRYKNEKLLYRCTELCNLQGKVIKASFNDISCTYTWDKAGRCTEINTPFYHQSLSYDPVGNLISSNNEQFSYDDLNQLITEKDQEYTYDSLNNRRSINAAKNTLNAFNQLLKQGDDTYSYDANGRRISKNEISYSYDALGHLKRVNDIVYHYDAFGRRVKQVEGEHSVDYLYQFDTEMGSHAQELTEFRLIHNQFTTAAIELENHIYFPIRNHRGDIVQLIDEKSTLKSSYQYDAFGNTTFEGSIASPWLFSGKRYEPSTGLYHFNERDYDPQSSRWLKCDPMGYADGSNLYAYVHNNPLTYIDPYGLFREETKDFCNGLSRGAIDDTTWNASSMLFGEYQPRNSFERIGYHVGTAASLIGGLYYGATELKIAKGVCSLFRRAMQKSPALSIKTLNAAKTVTHLEKTQVSADLAKMSIHIADFHKSEKVLVKSVGDNTKIWSTTKHKNSVENAHYHWQKHGSDFPEFFNAKQYVEGTRSFINSPPPGTLTKVRMNGDTVIYNPCSNTFAIICQKGQPRTMFKPSKHPYPTNLEYFHAQK